MANWRLPGFLRIGPLGALRMDKAAGMDFSPQELGPLRTQASYRIISRDKPIRDWRQVTITFAEIRFKLSLTMK
jgi:hypothetical protein